MFLQNLYSKLFNTQPTKKEYQFMTDTTVTDSAPIYWTGRLDYIDPSLTLEAAQLDAARDSNRHGAPCYIFQAISKVTAKAPDADVVPLATVTPLVTAVEVSAPTA